MNETSYSQHRFPPHIIQHAVWLYTRFTVSYRDIEDLLAERGPDISAIVTLTQKLTNFFELAEFGVSQAIEKQQIKF